MKIQKFYEILTEKLGVWLHDAVAALPNVVVAVLVVALFAILSNLVASLVRRVTSRATDSRALVGLVSGTTRYVVIACGLFVALGVLGLQKTVFSLLAGAGIVGLAVGFAFQDLAANFISGILIAFQRPFRIGDVIECSGFMGKVSKMQLRNTTIETFSGQFVVMPNRKLFENPLTNFSQSGVRRIDLEVGVGYDADLQRVSEVAREAIQKLDFLLEDKPVLVTAKEFGGSSINFDVRYWIDYPDGDVGYLDAIHRGVLALKAAFDDAGIDIPYPIRTLDFSLTRDTAAKFEVDDQLREAS